MPVRENKFSTKWFWYHHENKLLKLQTRPSSPTASPTPVRMSMVYGSSSSFSALYTMNWTLAISSNTPPRCGEIDSPIADGRVSWYNPHCGQFDNIYQKVKKQELCNVVVQLLEILPTNKFIRVHNVICLRLFSTEFCKKGGLETA